MYNITGPSKIVAKSTRRGRGISERMDRDYSRKPADVSTANGPKPVFHQPRKYNNIHRKKKDEYHITQEHEAMVKHIQESWNNISSTCDNNNNFYYEDAPAPSLKNFKPFDLEAWWGRQLYDSVTNSTN